MNEPTPPPEKAHSANACSYCLRTFGSRVTWRGRPVWLRREREHPVPKAAGGRKTIHSCHLCNRIKGSMVFGSIAEIRAYCLDALLKDGSKTLVAVEPINRPARACGWCGGEFVSSQPAARHCSKECAWKAWDDEHPRLVAAPRKTRTRPPIRQDRTIEKKCESCGVAFMAASPAARLCSQACRLVEWAKRKMILRPHRRTTPRMWEIVDLAAVPREYLAVVAKRIDRALASGIDVPGVRLRER